jgi:D-glycerate 3-kinase
MNQKIVDNLKLESFVNQRRGGSKSEFYDELLAEVKVKCRSLGLEQEQAIVTTFEQLWLPVALDLATAKGRLNRTFVQGILGGQGTGKSTLCIILRDILGYLGFSTANLSLDDLYLTLDERQALQKKDPRLLWRGPPRTHSISLGMKVLEQCRQEGNTTQIIKLPRFDKSVKGGKGDRTTPEVIDKPDILLFEGWFVGVQPIEESAFNNCPPPIITEEDRQFAIDNNQHLKAYEPLWSKLNSTIVLHPEDYRLSKQWRKDAEHQMIAQGKPGMTDEEIDRFVEYFWKALHPELFITPLTNTADLVVEIKSDRSLGRIYRSANSSTSLLNM